MTLSRACYVFESGLLDDDEVDGCCGLFRNSNTCIQPWVAEIICGEIFRIWAWSTNYSVCKHRFRNKISHESLPVMLCEWSCRTAGIRLWITAMNRWACLFDALVSDLGTGVYIRLPLSVVIEYPIYSYLEGKFLKWNTRLTMRAGGLLLCDETKSIW